MPFCPQCGIDNPAAARYCDQCGAVLIPVSAAQTAAHAAAAPPVAAPPPSTAPTGPMPSAPVQAAPPAVAPLASGSVVCPQCGTTAIPGEAFCDNCGAPLSAPARPMAQTPAPPYNAGLASQPVYPPPQPAGAAPAPQPSPPPIFQQPPSPLPAPPHSTQPKLPPRHLPTQPAPAGQHPTQPIPSPSPTPPRTVLAPAQLTVVTSGVVLPLPNSTQAVVGRADPVSKFYPDIDLTTHGALDHGVGRRHLRLFIQGGQVMVEDMDSTNGSTLNGQRLAARQPHPLHNGDQIQAGKLLLRFQL